MPITWALAAILPTPPENKMSYRELQDVIEMEDARIEAAQCGVLVDEIDSDQGDAQ